MKALLNSDTFQRQVGDAIHGFVATGKPDRAWYASWPLPNVWVGVTVEDQERADLRIPALLVTPAAVRFLSCEPLISAVDLSPWLQGQPGREADSGSGGPDSTPAGQQDRVTCPGCGAVRSQHGDGQEDRAADILGVGPGDIDWVIAGGESGRDARPMHPDWARSLRDQCQATGVPFLFKQRGEWTWSEPGRFQLPTPVLP